MSVLNCTNKKTNPQSGKLLQMTLSVFGRTTLHEWIPATATLEQGVLVKELEEQEGYLG